MGKAIPQNRWTDREVEEHWDRVASIYVQENNRVKETHDQRFYASVEHLRLEEEMKVLNISSRDAEATEHILKSQPSCKVINAEISAQLMEVAKEIRPFITQQKIDSYSSLPFADGEFDRILSLETLEHVSEPIRFLRELHRVSVPDSILVLTCPPATSEIPYRIYTALFGGHGEGPHRFPPSGRVKRMFEQSGWELFASQGNGTYYPWVLRGFGIGESV